MFLNKLFMIYCFVIESIYKSSMPSPTCSLITITNQSQYLKSLNSLTMKDLT